LVTLITLFKRYHFAADYDFVNSIGQLTRYRDFDLYLEGFSRHPKHYGFLRRVLRLRVSSHRLRVIVRETMVREKKAKKSQGSSAVDPALVTSDGR
jgi:hypothetical protein